MAALIDSSARVSSSRAPRSRNWCFTLQQPDGLLEFSGSPDVQYAVYQGEIAASGMYHFQGYIQFSESYTMSRVRSVIGGKPHLEIRAGPHKTAVLYCTKEDTRVDGPYHYGEPVDDKNAGKRTDLDGFYKQVRGGATDLELADDNFGLFCRYLRGIDRVRLASSAARKEKTSVILLIGPSGTGKTSWVHRYASGSIYTKPKDGWWNGYHGQPNVLLDDMADWLPYQMLLDICDRYPTSVPQKLGSPVVFNSRAIYITCVRPPKQWGYHVYSLIEFYRRVDIVYEFSSDFDVVKRSIGFIEGDDSLDGAISEARTCPPWAESAGSQDSPIEIE